MAVVRGKIDLSGTVKNKIARRRILSCEYDDLSENNLLNQILKTTVMLLLLHSKVDAEYKGACCQTGNLQKVIHRKDLVFQAGTLASDVDRRLNSFRKITYTAKAKVSPFSAGTIALLFRIFS
jgi:5-methylcytosine-specific restriction endonuclease McrBC regulatory subunit McrC